MAGLFAIAFGGALGALGRYLLGGYIMKFTNAIFPWGTLVVNLIGSFFIGFFGAFFANRIVSHNVRGFLLIGFLGAFTTFSTFSFENVQLLKNSEYFLSFLYIAANLLGGVGLAFAGMFFGAAL